MGFGVYGRRPVRLRRTELEIARRPWPAIPARAGALVAAKLQNNEKMSPTSNTWRRPVAGAGRKDGLRRKAEGSRWQWPAAINPTRLPPKV